MKKFLRFLLALLGIIVLGILVLGLIEPQDCTIQRSIVINAPKTAVFEQIVKFKNWPHWSPWYQMDTSVQMTYIGTDGTQGSGYHWLSTDKKNNTGEGEMKNTGSDGTKMSYSLHFIKPMAGDAAGFFTTADTMNGQSRVTWSITMHKGYPFNAINIIMDKVLGGQFEQGLQNMKKYIEANPTASSTTPAGITETDQPAMMFAGVRKQMGWNEMEKFYMDTYPMLGKALHPDMNTHAGSLFYKWDTLHHSTDVAAVFPVKDTSAHMPGISYFYVPAGKAYVSIHNGGYASEGKEHNALMQYIASKNMHPHMVMEEYVTGPMTEKDSTKWVTKIIYTVQ